MATIFETLTMIAVNATKAAIEEVVPAPVVGAPSHDAVADERFEPFVAIDVRHGFHNGSDGLTPDITITASAHTRERLRLFGFLPHRRFGGLDLLWTAETRMRANRAIEEMRRRGSDPGLARLRRQLSEPLLFAVRVANPRFVTFTAMPTSLRLGDPPLLLSNRRNRPGTGRTAMLTLDWSRRMGGQSLVESGGWMGRTPARRRSRPLRGWDRFSPAMTNVRHSPDRSLSRFWNSSSPRRSARQTTKAGTACPWT